MARHSSFNQRVADAICKRIAHGESLRAICRETGMPDKSTVLRWLDTFEIFRSQYARAREVQADHWAEEIVEISDDGTGDTWIDANGNERTNNDVIQRSRLRVDTRKWLMARMAPKKYGDAMKIEASGALSVETPDMRRMSAEDLAEIRETVDRIAAKRKATGANGAHVEPVKH